MECFNNISQIAPIYYAITDDQVVFPENGIWSSPKKLLYRLLWKVTALSKSRWEGLNNRSRQSVNMGRFYAFAWAIYCTQFSQSWQRLGPQSAQAEFELRKQAIRNRVLDPSTVASSARGHAPVSFSIFVFRVIFLTSLSVLLPWIVFQMTTPIFVLC